MSEPKQDNEAACGRSDSTAELATEFNPMADGELHDDGPWVASDDGRAIHSDDFTHDATLRVIGDFYDDEQRKAYSDNLVAKLNAVLTVANVELTGGALAPSSDRRERG